jgi:hypothetical protein
MRTACELPFLKSLVLAMANPFWMYVYILAQEKMNAKLGISRSAARVNESLICLSLQVDDLQGFLVYAGFQPTMSTRQ